jgi:hypothetical protein
VSVTDTATVLASFTGTIAVEWLQLDPGLIAPGWHLESQPTVNSYMGFTWQTGAAHWLATVPTWFLVVGTLAVSPLPWRRFRFSLRTLLIATTVVAALLGFMVWAAN